jgi:hypothetical protein
VTEYNETSLDFTVVYIDEEDEFHDKETWEELCDHLVHLVHDNDDVGDGSSIEDGDNDVDDDVDDYEDRGFEDDDVSDYEDRGFEDDDCHPAFLAEQSLLYDSLLPENTEDTEGEQKDGRLGNEFVMPNSFGGGQATQRAAYPQLGTTGFIGNAQNKPYFKLEVNKDQSGARVIPVSTTRCTPMAQMYMPFAKFFPNKVLNVNFFSSIWRLTLLCLQWFSPLHSVIFERLKTNTKKDKTDTVSALTTLLKQLVQCLQDYDESIVSKGQIYSRWEVTITFDLSTLDEEVPTLPIQPGTCPLDALVVVDSVSFRKRFSSFLSLMTVPLGALAKSKSSLADVRAMITPNAKAAIICLIEMAVNTVGGGGVGKASVLGTLLKRHPPGSYDGRFLSPLSSDLTKISRKDHCITGLCFGISPDFLGFQYVLDETTHLTAVTISKTTEFDVSKYLKCPNSFLECMQRIFGSMVSAPPNAVEHSQTKVSFLQELEFPRIAGYNLVQVRQLFKSIAGFLLKLYRSEWANIIAHKCQGFPFNIKDVDGQPHVVSSAAGLQPHLVAIRCDRTLNRVWPWIKPHLKSGDVHKPKQKPVDSISESICWPSLIRGLSPLPSS